LLAGTPPQLFVGDPGRPLKPLKSGADVVRDDHLDGPEQIRRHVVGNSPLEHRVTVRRLRKLSGDRLKAIFDSEELAGDQPEGSLASSIVTS
jgi:hypothetical protein